MGEQPSTALTEHLRRSGTGGDYCRVCGHQWPCPSVTAMNERDSEQRLIVEREDEIRRLQSDLAARDARIAELDGRLDRALRSLSRLKEREPKIIGELNTALARVAELEEDLAAAREVAFTEARLGDEARQRAGYRVLERDAARAEASALRAAVERLTLAVKWNAPWTGTGLCRYCGEQVRLWIHPTGWEEHPHADDCVYVAALAAVPEPPGPDEAAT